MERRLPVSLGSALTAAAVFLTGSPLVPAEAAEHPGPPRVAHPDAVADRRVTLRMPDGTGISARVTEPAASGQHPLLLLPTAWSVMPTDALAGDLPAQLAARGYVVVRYDPRGLRSSGGGVDFAGPADTRDASAIITWALRHTAADPGRVGMLGHSYAAAISLNTAAHDPRVRAVAALSPWTDLLESSLPNGTPAGSITAFQQLIGDLNGRLSPATREAADHVKHGDNLAALRAWAAQRSAASQVRGLNAHRTAVLMTSEWNDPLVPAGQTGRFLDRLTGPRQLIMDPGGHGDAHAPEEAVLHPGTPLNERALAWLAEHLTGRPGDPAAHVLVHPRGSARKPAYERYPSWAALEQGHRQVPLAPHPSAGDTVTVTTAIDSPADSGLFPVSGRLDTVGLPPTVSFPALAPPLAAVWTSGAATRPMVLRGSPRVATRVTPTARQGTFVAYLYDVSPFGTGQLLTHAPFTFRSALPGAPLRVDLRLPATAWDVPAGHRLALVIDTGDHRYTGVNPLGSTLTFDSRQTRLVVPDHHG